MIYTQNRLLAAFPILEFLCISLLFFTLCFPISATETDSCLEISPATLSETISCSGEYSRVLTLSSDSHEYLIQFPNLLETPVVPSIVSCKLFLRNWAVEAQADRKGNLSLCLEKLEHSEPMGLYRFKETYLEDACIELGYCARHLFDFFQADEQLRSCHPHKSISGILSDMTPHLRKVYPKPIAGVQLALFPFVPLLEEFRRYSHDLQPGEAAFASTMSIGKGTATHLLLDARKTPDIGKFVMLDAGLAVSEKENFLPVYFSGRQQFHALPITSGRSFDTVFHWKIVFNSRKKRASLSSLNLSSPEKTRFIDAVYRFRDPDVTGELIEKYLGLAATQCAHPEDFACLSKIAQPEEESSREYQKMSQRACEYLGALKFAESEAESGSFLDPTTHDVEALVIEMIDQARHEVILFSHKFSLRGIAEHLAAAKERGVRVLAFTAKSPQLSEYDREIFYPGNRARVRSLPEPHLKAMLIDRKELFFGTGNFTRNAFHRAKELFAVTRDPAAVRKLVQVAAFLARAHELPHRELFGTSAPESHWLVSGEGAGSEKELAPLTIPNSRDGLQLYREIIPEAHKLLESCELDHLLFVPEQDLLACAKSHKTKESASQVPDP